MSEITKLERKVAGAICCEAHVKGCAAQDPESEFTACQMSTFIRDARNALAAIGEEFVLIPKPPSDMKLSASQLATLSEMKSYPNGYYFRQATCMQLAELGMAVPLRTDVQRRPYQITKAGLAALAQLTRGK